MIHGKGYTSIHRDDNLSSITTTASVSSSDVLGDLFRARQEQDLGRGVLDHVESVALNQAPRRTSPLIADTMDSAIFCRDDFVNKSSEWDTDSLFGHLGRQRIHRSTNASNTDLSWFSTTFERKLMSPGSPMTGDTELDQTVRSLSNSVMNNSNNNNRRKRPRQMATRIRLVSQVIGQKGVQKVVALVKEIQQLRDDHQSNSSFAGNKPTKAVRDIFTCMIVDAWENTPLDDLKSLDWEEYIQQGEERVRAYRAWL